jgi:hypothetical protein
MNKFTVGSVIKLERTNYISISEILTVSDDLRELYIELSKWKSLLPDSNFFIIHTVNDKPLKQNLNDAINELVEILSEQHRFIIESVDSHMVSQYAFYANENDLITALHIANDDPTRKLIIHDTKTGTENKLTISEHIYLLLKNQDFPDMSDLEVVELKLDVVKEFHLHSRLVMHGNADEKQKAKIIIEYLAQKMASL